MEKKKIKPISRFKVILGLVIGVMFIFLAMFLYSVFVGFDTANTQKAKKYSKEEIEYAKQDRKVPEDIKTYPRVIMEIKDSEYKTAADFYNKHPKADKQVVDDLVKANKLPKWYPRGESPILSKLVKEGKLPPVAERTGPEPVVERGCDGIGKYGGTWLRETPSKSRIKTIIQMRLAGATFLKYSPFAYPIVPNIAKKVEMLDGGRIWEVTLRKIKWSDGVPFTADDVMFSWMWDTDSIIDDGLPMKYMMINGKYGRIEKVNKYKVKFIFPGPYGSFNYQLAFERPFLPKHYLEKFHPLTGDKKFIEKEMKAYKFVSNRQLFTQMAEWTNPECPTLNPWILRHSKSTGPFTFVRNPYYYAVDEEGNQLPYIDRLQFDIVDAKMIPVNAANGKVSMQNTYIFFDNYTDLKTREKESNIKVYNWLSGDVSSWGIYPNSNRAVMKSDPQSGLKAKLLSNKYFRQGLSTAIDRKKISDSVYYGQGVAEQINPGPLSPFYNQKFANAYTVFNKDKANKLLDDAWKSIGLDPDKRVDGYRCDANGKPLTFYLTVSEFTGLGPVQFVVDDWAKVGVRCIYNYATYSLLVQERNSLSADFLIWISDAEVIPLASARFMLAYDVGSMQAVGWGRWYSRGGMYDSPESKLTGCIPIPKDNPMYEALEYYQKARQSPTVEGQKKYLDKVFNLCAEQIWTINVVTQLPLLVVASADMKNIPNKAYYSYRLNSPSNAGVDTFYFEHPDRSSDGDTYKQLTTLVPLKRYDGTGKTPTESSYLWSALGIVFAVIIILLIILVIIKHPFVIKRILIMIPTLFIISICVFTIVEVPPSDFLTLKIQEYQSSGLTESQIKTHIAELKEYFHYDEPGWKRYCRWTGLYWFTSFKPSDKGLLQGEMGRSMDSLDLVNSMIGDRLLLTLLIALGTIIFTWIIALPIGIYSACRQYSKSDYLFTLIGFIGMSIPAFLLALIFSAITGMSGLFSAKYMMQPYWDIDKIIDLLKHIWVPIFIMGITGTAGMIRVMRANLLDELKKPYVVTAMAKGVKPITLLFKYPVRIAINPFVSGLGSILPSLISGTALVAIVLSLPTVGPLLYSATLSQDTILAGSMLMSLAVLSLVGTLVSDILLSILDPRIRITGGKK